MKPTTRRGCPEPGPSGWRECPWASCRHHLYLDISASGKLRLHPRAHRLDAAEMAKRQPVCSLDVAAYDGASREDVGRLMGLSRPEVRAIEQRALRKIMTGDAAAAWRELADYDLCASDAARALENAKTAHRAPVKTWAYLTPRERLAAAREARGWTQGDVADRIGRSRGAVRDVECDRASMRSGTAQGMARLLGLTTNDLYGDEPPEWMEAA